MRRAQPQDEALLRQIWRQDRYIGERMETAWLTYGADNAVCAFFIADEAAAVMTLGNGALSCGVMQEEELASFLRFCGVRRYMGAHTPLSAWRPQPLLMMHASAVPPLETVQADLQPDLWQLAHSGLLQPIEPEAWYADICPRVNRALARVAAASAPEGFVSTAGLYSIGSTTAYLSGVYTRPEYRGRGYASTLISALAAQVQDKEITLICKPELRSYYEMLNFTLLRPVCEYRCED